MKSESDNPANRSLRENLRALPAPVWVLFAGTFVNKFGAFVIPFLTLYLSKEGYGLRDAGFALAAYGAGNFLAAGYGGFLADRIGRRKTIVISMAGGAITMVLLAHAQSIGAIIALASLTGFATELYRPAASALLIDLVPEKNRITAFAAYRLSFNAGWAFGPAAAGFLAKYSYTWLFYGDALSCALYGVIAWFFLPKGVMKSKSNHGWGAAARVIGRDRRFLVVIISYLLIGMVFFQYVSTYGIFLKDLGFDERTFGFLLGFNGLIIVICELPLTQWTRRLPPVRAISCGYLLIGLGALTNAWPHSLPWLFFGITLMSFGEILCMPVAIAFVSSLAPDHMRGRYMGAVGLVWSFCFIAAPTLGLRLHEANPSAVWLAGGAMGAAAALWILRLRRGR